MPPTDEIAYAGEGEGEAETGVETGEKLSRHAGDELQTDSHSAGMPGMNFKLIPRHIIKIMRIYPWINRNNTICIHKVCEI